MADRPGTPDPLAGIEADLEATGDLALTDQLDALTRIHSRLAAVLAQTSDQPDGTLTTAPPAG